ncbi:MAG: MAPEG family protein [Xanthobacteraceae bacterium]|jgi:glutathione S-transferase
MLHWTAFVTILAVLVYFYTGYLVGRARQQYGVAAPAIIGNPDFERVFRVQMNTLEWMPIFLPLVWLFAYYLSDRGAAVLGLVWCAGRVLYIFGYSKAAANRGLGFGIQAVVCLVLLIGALAGIVLTLAHNG